MDYPIEEFIKYCNVVLRTMRKRSYKVSESSIHKLEDYVDFKLDRNVEENNVYVGWHNLRYLNQCFYNLEEKMDCDGVTTQEWQVLLEGYKEITGKEFED